MSSPLTDKQKQVLSQLDNTGKHPRDIAEELGYSESAYIFGPLKALLKKGLAIKFGKHKKVKYKLKENE